MSDQSAMPSTNAAPERGFFRETLEQVEEHLQDKFLTTTTDVNALLMLFIRTSFIMDAIVPDSATGGGGGGIRKRIQLLLFGMRILSIRSPQEGRSFLVHEGLALTFVLFQLAINRARPLVEA